jgi:hypothetical protein
MTSGGPPGILGALKSIRLREDETMVTTILDRRVTTEEDSVHAWRAAQLERLGVPEWMADVVADRIDWHEIAALVERGCSARLALEILR